VRTTVELPDPLYRRVRALAAARGTRGFSPISGGEALATLRREGRAIDVRDALQAGVCLDAGVPLVTRNVRHFERVPGLRVVAPDAWS